MLWKISGFWNRRFAAFEKPECYRQMPWIGLDEGGVAKHTLECMFYCLLREGWLCGMWYRCVQVQKRVSGSSVKSRLMRTSLRAVLFRTMRNSAVCGGSGPRWERFCFPDMFLWLQMRQRNCIRSWKWLPVLRSFLGQGGRLCRFRKTSRYFCGNSVERSRWRSCRRGSSRAHRSGWRRDRFWGWKDISEGLTGIKGRRGWRWSCLGGSRRYRRGLRLWREDRNYPQFCRDSKWYTL